MSTRAAIASAHDLKLSTHHEAGHAVACEVLGVSWSSVEVDPTKLRWGAVTVGLFANPDQMAVVSLAGHIADSKWAAENPGRADPGSFEGTDDHRDLMDELRRGTIDRAEATLRTQRLIHGNWARVTSLATRLEAQTRGGTRMATIHRPWFWGV